MGQEIMEKPPEGFRRASFEEEREFLQKGMAVQLLSAKLAQFNAEFEASRLKIKDAASEYNLAVKQLNEAYERLGIKGNAEDLKAIGQTLYIREKRTESKEVPKESES